MESQGNRMYTLQELCRFLIPSVLGTVIFLLPIQWQGNMTILIGIITDLMQKLLAPVITTVVAAAIVLSAVCSTVRRFLKPAWIVESERWESLFPVIHSIMYAVFWELCLRSWFTLELAFML